MFFKCARIALSIRKTKLRIIRRNNRQDHNGKCYHLLEIRTFVAVQLVIPLLPEASDIKRINYQSAQIQHRASDDQAPALVQATQHKLLISLTLSEDKMSFIEDIFNDKSEYEESNEKKEEIKRRMTHKATKKVLLR